MQEKRIMFFDEGTKDMRVLLGGKGAGLAEMTRVGLPVPPGFTVTTVACMEYFARRALSEETLLGIEAAVRKLESLSGKLFGNPANPLLVSVRSGSAFSMPGMMDTVLNLGLNEEVVRGLGTLTSPRFALDCYRRFIEKYSEIVLKVPHHHFADCLDDRKRSARVRHDYELDEAQLAHLVAAYRDIVAKYSDRPFPDSPWEQLFAAVDAVFASWDNPRAKVYRQAHGISDAVGTAVNVQSMVFGNLGASSGTGVCFTRNPSTGAKELFGEYLVAAQGEDVVSGTRTPERISTMADLLPDAYEQLEKVARQLEFHYGDMQDIEFTIERGKLYLLQTRAGKRGASAAVRMAVEMAAEGLIDQAEALRRVKPEQIEMMLHRAIDYSQPLVELTRGLPASPGAATGAIVFDNEGALRLTKMQRKVILLRPETSPDDIAGIIASDGIVTSRGGMTSHAAVVARGMGKPCVCGADSVRIDLVARTARIGDRVFKEGDIISLDGQNGKVFMGAVPLVEPEQGREFTHLLEIADAAARLEVRANADNPQDADLARKFGAKGIGLCRTEHMFMDADRLPFMQAMIMAEHDEDRQYALSKLLPMQRHDFYGILKAMNGYPVTIRLLDPPLHEFLPAKQDLVSQIADAKSHGERVKAERALRVVEQLHESNPMLGHRGCRLGITIPSVYAMQIEAIAEATFDLLEEGLDPQPEIMIPLVGHHRELIVTRRLTENTWAMIEKRRGQKHNVAIGTMIELPRACLVAGELAKHAEFFSFGTNDLTQTTFGFSRDDVEGKFMPAYLSQDILPHNPFAIIDRNGVGRLMQIAVAEGRAAKPSLKVGICGEHGGEANSIAFCSEMGLDYVSCSPYRVPVARFAAGRALYLTDEPTDK